MSGGADVAPGRPLRFAVVGCGVIGRVHARAIGRTTGAELAVAVDLVESAAKEVAHEYGGEPALSLEEALARDDVDAVAVCTPSGEHAELAIQALRAGKHVVVEKPLDVTLEAAEAVCVVAQESGCTVTVVSQHRFDRSSLAVHQAVLEERLGRLTSAVASVAWWRSDSYYESGDWRGTWALDGGGALMNQSIHTLDLMLWMLGTPVEVSAMTGRLAHESIEVEDTAVAVVRFASGALGVLHATTAAYPGLSARLQVHGTRGSAIIDDDELTYFQVAPPGERGPAPAQGAVAESTRASTAVGSGAQGNAQGAGSNPSSLSDAHDLQYADFVDAVRTGRQPHVTVESATSTLRVVLAVYRSAAEGRPVSLVG